MKSLNNRSIWFVLIVGLAVGFSSCSDMDEYKKYVEEEGEISYTGKIDSLTVYSGHNRVMVEGLFIADPKINEARIFWNNGGDSVVVPVNRSAGVDTMQKVIDGLQEKVYNFKVITYDSLGNSSLPVNGNARVYGERYQHSLNNRPIVSKDLYAGDLNTTLNYGSMDLTSGVFATQIEYTDANEVTHTMELPIDSEEIVLENYKIGTEFKYRTLFLPEPTSIDTFYTEFDAVVPDISYLKNYEVPFEAEATSGRWGILAHWTTNEAAKNHGGYGGWDEWNGNIFNVESGWGAPGITNGKIYQTVTLSPGTYTFKANLRNGNDTSNSGEGDYAYLVVADGGTLPDVNDGAIENDPATIGYSRILQSKDPDDFQIEFTISQQQQVSVGYATTQPGGWISEGASGRHCNIVSFEFFKQ
ncbi:DUF5013 domain-containing protein [Aliifodinibius sp. S!AR15-10]|uniref:DUF4998 domain-containing protein n=1 Tax=Aliifodinibius sp. S!AR15-10 TaxID=2950437 RepID=UPI00285C64CE|nr:DUF4998 domain-containing protein [Aliifodinibius sp. S!AR15-10]MDR8392776.1 DUF5013 domain-containing protein [Aliifodinibius sp. S!AR15-10]